MYEIAPEQLIEDLLNLPTGSLLLCRRQFRWLDIAGYIKAFMGWVLNPKGWKINGKNYYHGAILRWDQGIPFIVEATFFQRSRPKTVGNWIAGRKGDVIGVKPNSVPDINIVRLLDLPYDLPAAISLVWLRVTGRWTGHTGAHATKRNWCLELIARALGLENAHAVLMADLIV